jgi:hypothetical protein
MATTPVPKHLGNGLVGSTPTPIYTVPLGVVSATIRSITGANNTSTPQSIKVWLVPASEALGDANLLIPNMLVLGNGTVTDDSVHVLETGGAVVAQGSVANAFSVVVDGAENIPA